MGKSIGIKILSILANAKESDLDGQIKKLSTEIKERLVLKLKIDASDLKVLTKQVDEVKKKIRTTTATKDSLFINDKVEKQAFGEITARLREVKRNVDELAQVKTKYSLDAQGKNRLETATLTYYNKTLGQTITETMRWKESTKTLNGEKLKTRTFASDQIVATDNMSKARAETDRAAKAQAKLNKELALYKEKMLGGHGLKGTLTTFSDQHAGRLSESDKNVLTQIRTDVEGLNINTPDLTNKMKGLTQQTTSLKQQSTLAGKATTSMFENLVKFARYYIVAGGIIKLIGILKNGISTVTELDTALTELSRVSNATGEQLERIAERAYRAGEAIGRTGKEVINAISEWVRAGYTMEEAFNLSRQSLILTNVGDGINDVKEASSSLIAVLRGFKLEASETARVVDALNEVSNNYALNVSNLTEILKRTSGTLAQTGTSYEQLIGLATGGFESLRNAEMVASGKFCPYVQKCA